MYVQDYDEKFPLSYGSRPGQGTPPGGWADTWSQTNSYWYWANMVWPYTKNQQIYSCPSGPIAGNMAIRFGGYGANELIVRSSDGLSMAAINTPANTYLLMDAGQSSVGTYSASTGNGSNYYIPGIAEYTSNPNGTVGTAITGTYLKDFQTGRHFQGVNVAFTDGHAKWLKSATVCDEGKKGAAGAWRP